MYKLQKSKKIGIITVILALFILIMGDSNSFFIPRDEVELTPSYLQITSKGGLK